MDGKMWFNLKAGGLTDMVNKQAALESAYLQHLRRPLTLTLVNKNDRMQLG